MHAVLSVEKKNWNFIPTKQRELNKRGFESFHEQIHICLFDFACRDTITDKNWWIFIKFSDFTSQVSGFFSNQLQKLEIDQHRQFSF